MKKIIMAVLFSWVGMMMTVAQCAADPASPSAVQDSKIEAQLVRCAAVYFIISGTAVDDKTNEKKFQAMASNFLRVYAREKNNLLTAAEMKSRRDLIVRDAVENYPVRHDGLHEEAVVCGAWYEAFQFQDENYAYIPVIPKVIPGKVRQDYAEIAATAFQAWANNGFALPNY